MIKYIVNNTDSLKKATLYLLVACLPFYISISSVLIIVAALLSLLKIFSTKQFNFKRIDPLSIAFIGYFILEMLGLFYTDNENFRYGLSTLEKHQALLLFPLIFLDFTIDSNYRNKLLLTFIMSCLIACLICVGVNMYLSLTIHHEFFQGWLFSHDRISDPIGLQAVYLAMYLCFGVLVLLFALFNYGLTLPIHKGILVVILLFFLVMISALGARTVTVGLNIIIVINLFIYARARKSYKILFAAVLVPLVFVVLIFFNSVVYTRFVDMLSNSYEDSNYGSYFARWKIWEPGLEAIGENIWFGVGTGDHQTELDKKFIKYNYTEGVDAFNMHNLYLQTVLNFGIVGLVIFSLVFFYQLKKGLKDRNLLYLSFLLLFMFEGLTESLMNRNKGVIFFLVFSFIFYKTKELKETTKPSIPS